MTVFILNHLLAVVIVTLGALCLVLALALCRAAAIGDARVDWPKGPPRIRLDWVETTPVAIIESSPETAADVAAWLDAVKEGAVLRV